MSADLRLARKTITSAFSNLFPEAAKRCGRLVKLGRSSVNSIEIVNGLQPGDQVILSDTSAWDAHERIRLN